MPDNRFPQRIPLEIADEMGVESKRTGIGRARFVVMGWEAIRDRVRAIPSLKTIQMEAVYRNQPQTNPNESEDRE